MNFFRKEGKVFISLGEPDLDADPQRLRENLAAVFSEFTPESATLRFPELRDMQLPAFSVIANLAAGLRERGVRISFEAPAALSDGIRKLNLAGCFHNIAEIE